MIKAVFFDVDDTIYSYTKAHPYGFEAVCAYAVHQLGLDRETFARLHQEQMSRHVEQVGANCAATHNRLIRYQCILERLRLPLTHAPIMERLYWETMLAHMEPAPGLLETARSIREKGLVLGIGTNMTADWQYEKLSRLGLLPLADVIVSSEEVNVEKPDPGLFLACAEKAGCAPAECAFVGDSLHHDVSGAMAAGMQAVWYCPDSDGRFSAPEGVWVISRLPQLLPALDRSNPYRPKGGAADEA